VGYYGPLTVLIYFIIWSMINGPLAKSIINVVYKQDKKEGDFRYYFNCYNMLEVVCAHIFFEF
jgi:ABC-type uncharacterized transport system fused permease/ATPase subunit